MIALLFLLSMTPVGATVADDDQVGSTYARVRSLEGTLTVQRTGEGEVAEAGVNTPLAAGDSAWTDDGRAEIELTDGSVIRLDQGTRVDFRTLSDLNNEYERTNLIALEQGSLRIEAPESQRSDRVFQIDTEGGSVYLLSGGSFRIDAEGSVITVSSFRGVGELSGDGGSVLVRSGERASVRRGGTPTEPRPFNTLRQDEFDRFSEEREAAYLRHDQDDSSDQVQDSVPREVDPYVGELSAYGDWQSLPEYGWVWRPRYVAGWGPYVDGEWEWYPSGWVWVSYDPWGWAPYHYGRWDFAANVGWFWIPGRVWAGAWVSFAVGPSYIGWCPLNFYNRPVFQTVNVVNVTNVSVTRLDARGWRFVPSNRFGVPRGDRAILRPDRMPRNTNVVLTNTLPRFDPRGLASRPDGAARFMQTVRESRTPFPASAGSSERPVPFRALERGAGSPRPQATSRESFRPAPRAPAAFPRGQAVPRDRRPVNVPGVPAPSRVDPSVGGPPRPPLSPVDRGREVHPDRGADVRRLPTGEPPRIRQPGPQPRELARSPYAAPSSGPEQEDRPRDHAVERLFNGVRRERPEAAPASPVRPETRHVAPPRPEPRPSAGPTQVRPREATPRQARPNRPRERHH